MDWFERITGFAEADAKTTRARLQADGETLVNAEQSRGASPQVLLTRLGGGVFGNDERWIDAAMKRALAVVAGRGLDVCRVVR